MGGREREEQNLRRVKSVKPN